MKKYLMGLLLLPAAVWAQTTDSARVVRSEPRFVTVQQQQCQDVVVSSNNSGSGAIVGAIAGGILGHQVGDGRGRDVATVLGAVVGANVGERIGQDQQNLSSRRECRVVPITVQRGRLVTFDYHGQLFTVTLDH
jgi:uncharacterized protein YcfJ